MTYRPVQQDTQPFAEVDPQQMTYRPVHQDTQPSAEIDPLGPTVQI